MNLIDVAISFACPNSARIIDNANDEALRAVYRGDPDSETDHMSFDFNKVIPLGENDSMFDVWGSDSNSMYTWEGRIPSIFGFSVEGSLPTEVFEKLSLLHPNHTFEIGYVGEDFAGFMSYTNGWCTFRNIDAENHRAELKAAKQVMAHGNDVFQRMKEDESEWEGDEDYTQVLALIGGHNNDIIVRKILGLFYNPEE